MQTSPRDGSPPAETAALTGQVLDGRFEVQRLIGRGGMSEVYLARQVPMGRVCAVKVLLPSRLAAADAVGRFEREAALAGRLGHPNLCRIYDSGRTQEGLPWLAMEWLDGQSLAELLGAGPIDPPRAAQIAADCAAGLASAHAVGIVHRDLKPDNVMVIRRDGGESAVVTDFGIARSGDDAAMTRDGLMVGTPEVMSPEQIAGDPVDPRSDQYQLALLVCRMLTTRLPFEGSTSQETMVKRLTEAPTAIRRLRPELTLPPAVQGVLDRGLARRPGDRFPGIREFAAALTAALGAGSDAPTEIMAQPAIGVAPSATGWSRSVRQLAGAALVGVIVTGIYLGSRPEDPAGMENPEGSTPPPAEPGTSPGGTPAPPPTVPPAAALPAPRLPAEEMVFSKDPSVRATARAQATRVYNSAAAAASDRALAAFFVAETYRADSLYATARQWLRDCLAIEERAMCQSLLNSLPPDREPLAS